MNKKIFLVLPAALLLIGASCSVKPSTPPVPANLPTNVPSLTPPAIIPPETTPPVSIPPATPAPIPVPTPPVTSFPAIRAITVTAVDFSYSPKTFEVSKGEKIKINFKNNGSHPHNLTIKELSLATTNVDPGAETTLDFTAPDTAQTLHFACTIDGHELLGLSGTIIVK